MGSKYRTEGAHLANTQTRKAQRFRQFTIIELGWILISEDVVLISSPGGQKENDKKGEMRSRV